MNSRLRNIIDYNKLGLFLSHCPSEYPDPYVQDPTLRTKPIILYKDKLCTIEPDELLRLARDRAQYIQANNCYEKKDAYARTIIKVIEKPHEKYYTINDLAVVLLNGGQFRPENYPCFSLPNHWTNDMIDKHFIISDTHNPNFTKELIKDSPATTRPLTYPFNMEHAKAKCPDHHPYAQKQHTSFIKQTFIWESDITLDEILAPFHKDSIFSNYKDNNVPVSKDINKK